MTENKTGVWRVNVREQTLKLEEVPGSWQRLGIRKNAAPSVRLCRRERRGVDRAPSFRLLYHRLHRDRGIGQWSLPRHRNGNGAARKAPDSASDRGRCRESRRGNRSRG